MNKEVVLRMRSNVKGIWIKNFWKGKGQEMIFEKDLYSQIKQEKHIKGHVVWNFGNFGFIIDKTFSSFGSKSIIKNALL